MKTCTKCVATKPLEDFYTKSAQCKSCRRAHQRIIDPPKGPKYGPYAKPGYKFCNKCKCQFLLSNFNKGQGKCKPCQYEYLRARNPRKTPVPRNGYKYCAGCKLELLYENFNNQKMRSAGQKLPYGSYCKKCKKEQGSIYLEKNRERLLEKSRAYYDANKEKCNEATKLSQRRNRAAGHKRKLRRRGLESLDKYLVTNKEFNKVKSSACFACGSIENITVDHIIPLVRGGGHKIGNLMSLCQRCNSSKNKLTYTEWKYSSRPVAVEVFNQ